MERVAYLSKLLIAVNYKSISPNTAYLHPGSGVMRLLDLVMCSRPKLLGRGTASVIHLVFISRDVTREPATIVLLLNVKRKAEMIVLTPL